MRASSTSWASSTLSRDNWERLVAAVIKREKIRQLCRQDSITTVDSDRTLSFSTNSVRSVSSATSPQHPLTRNLVNHEVLPSNHYFVVLQKLMKQIKLNEDLQKLKLPLHMIQDFLKDAETKQVTDNAIKRWLTKLEAVVTDADYVFDQLNHQHLRNKITKKNKASSLFSTFKSFTLRRRIKDIENELNSIHEEAMWLHLRTSIEFTPPTDGVFVGRENDALKIVEIVKNSPTDIAVSVIPIVGMGGLGKTALAMKVYNDASVISCFENRIWVRVSQNFDQVNVFKSILGAGGNGDESKEVVLRKVQEKLGGRRYVLVMDDVWNEDIQKWESFITSLEALDPVKGNVIIVTTRQGNFASLVKTNDIHELGLLSQLDCWCIIKDRVFGGDSVPSKFETVGKNIAQQCRGLPLAAKVVGDLLRGKSEDEWRSIEKNELFDFGRDLCDVTKTIC